MYAIRSYYALGLDEAVEELDAWLAATRPARLNVAGPRASKEPGLAAEVRLV